MVVSSLVMFGALHTAHAPFGYLEWLQAAAWAAAGNLAGGIGLVTVLRLLQVPHRVAAERANPAPNVAPAGNESGKPQGSAARTGPAG